MDETLTPEKSLPPLPRKAMIELFSTLQLIYKDRFIKRGENLNDMMMMWQHSLRATPDRVLKIAAEEVMKFHPSYPPLIGEFMKVIESINKVMPGERGGKGAPKFCMKCHSYEFTSHHKECCIDQTRDPKYVGP